MLNIFYGDLEDENHRYTKKHLNNYYLSEKNIKKVQKLMNKIKFNKEQ